ncbi:MAG: hypothetical protein ACTMKU_04780, partial [Actinomycetaceae bacterium]
LTAEDPLGAAQHHPWFVHGDEELVGVADHEIALGPDVLLAPVLAPGEGSVDVVLPPGRWVHVWSGEVHGDTDAVSELEVDAPLGEPALFVREGSEVAGELATFVEAERTSTG